MQDNAPQQKVDKQEQQPIPVVQNIKKPSAKFNFKDALKEENISEMKPVEENV